MKRLKIGLRPLLLRGFGCEIKGFSILIKGGLITEYLLVKVHIETPILKCGYRLFYMNSIFRSESPWLLIS